MSLLAACSKPLTPVTATDTPRPTNPPIPTEVATLIPILRPPPTIIPIEILTPTPIKTITPEPTKIIYPQYDRWVSGREALFSGNVLVTIDDCNNEELLNKMLDFLEARGIRVTFFPNSNYIIGHSSALWARIAKNHQIGYHTTDHKNSYSNPKTLAQLEDDLTKFENTIGQKTGNPEYKATAYRAPYFAWTPEFVQLAKNHGAWLIQATIAPTDVDYNTFNNMFMGNGNGGILIFHTDEISYRWFVLNLVNLKGNFLRIDDIFK